MLGYEFNARGAFLPKFLGFIFVLFVGILVVTWYISKQVDPVILDEHGAYRAGGHGQAR
ncbi:MAG TPA: hypothetical protein VGK29_13355 [Paludibaculum sp.]|jgi:hypothetical protein